MAMAPKTIRKAVRGLKDTNSIVIAKVGVSGTKAPELDVALVKATSHDDYFDEKYVQEILHLTSNSRGYVNACVRKLAKRLAKTRDWNVALKGLMLTHRLLRDGDLSFEDSLIHASQHGHRILNLSDFRDETHSNAWDYSAFVRSYGLFLDERLDSSIQVSGKRQGQRGRGETRGRRRSAHSKSPVRSSYGGSPSRSSRSRYGGSPDSNGYVYSDDRRHSNYDGGLSPRYKQKSGRRDDFDEKEDNGDDDLLVKEMTYNQVLVKLPPMQRLMERVLRCRPAGAAKTNRLVNQAMYLVITESIQLYRDLSDGCAILLEAFFDMEQKDRVKAFEIYYTFAKQGDELYELHKQCKYHGVGRSSEYIDIEPVAKEQLASLEEYLRLNAPNGNRSKSPEPAPLQLEYKPEIHEPAPEPEARPASPPPPPVHEAPAVVAEPQPAPTPSPEPVGDLLDLDKATISAEDQSNKFALALFSTSSTATTTDTWESFDNSKDDHQSALQKFNAAESGKAGWELALVASASDISKPLPPNRPMAGGFDPLLLDSMYSHGEVIQKQAAAAVPSGSASSVAIPNRPQSSFLALPAPPGGMPVPVNGEDPFSASTMIPPPSYVQMADLNFKQELLTQEQIMWQRYQTEGMRGEAGFMKLFNNPYAAMPAPNPMMYQNPYQVGMPVGSYQFR